jgi:hypothetical protein
VRRNDNYVNRNVQHIRSNYCSKNKMMMEKFCCDTFHILYSRDKVMGLNIRIIKLSKEFIQRGQLSIDKSYFITEGYSGDIFD